MFPMLVKSTAAGRTYEYIHLCESVWRKGRSSRRTVVSLGRKDLLALHLDRIYELCRGHRLPSPEDATPLNCFRLGPFLVLRRLWSEFAMPELLGPFSDRTLVLVANRLTAPASEHGLADWLRTYWVCDSQGRRFAPAFLSEAERTAAPNPRVKVKAFQLQKWYRTLDALLRLKSRIEGHLFRCFRHLFALQCDLVFYDLTSTYFEGSGPEEMARYGYSRDQRPGNPQVLVGVAMVDGLPISHTVFGGNRRDSTTVAEVIGDLRKRFGLGRFVLVGDRGMKSAGSLAALEREGLGYLMGVQGRRNPEMEAALQAMGEEAWEACVGSDGTAKTNGSRVQEVTEKGGGERRFLVHSPEREGHERRLREAEQEKVREGLERLKARVAAGEFRRRAEREPDGGKDEAGWIGEAAGKILGSRHGQRYYDWRLDEDGQLEYFENANCAKEKRREGHWLLETEETGLSAVEAVRAYQELWRVEAAFRTMKDVLELRPVWHQTPQRVQAHVLVASLALTFDRILQRKLEQAGLKLSSQAAWRALEAVNLVEFTMEGREPKAGVCINGEEGAPGNEARRVLRALGIRPQAPQPPANGDRIVY